MLDVRFSSALKAMLLLGHAEEEGSPVLDEPRTIDRPVSSALSGQ